MLYISKQFAADIIFTHSGKYNKLLDSSENMCH